MNKNKKCSSFESFMKYEVKANSLIEFLERYSKPKAHTLRGEEFVKARIESHQEYINKYDFTFITHHDSVTGEIVSYYPKIKAE